MVTWHQIFSTLNQGNSLARKYFAILIAASLALAATSRPAMADCTTQSDKWTSERPINTLKNPGWFDVGAGIVVVKNAGSSQQNGVGNMVSLRAYPLGRWYAPSITIDADKLATASSKTADAAKLQLAANKLAAPQAENTGQQTSADRIASASAAQTTATTAAADAAQSMQAAQAAQGDNFALCNYQQYQRISFFLGRSVGGFDSKAVDGDINAFGVAFDIAPEFAVVWGRAYYNLPTQTGVTNNSKSGSVFGVQINLNAFKTMRGLTGSL